jgi:hypothetical protein
VYVYTHQLDDTWASLDLNPLLPLILLEPLTKEDIYMKQPERFIETGTKTTYASLSIPGRARLV